MSHRASRLLGNGQFDISIAKGQETIVFTFCVLATAGALMKIVLTHKNGVPVNEYKIRLDENGNLDFSNLQTDFPKGYVVPQSLEQFDDLWLQLAEVDKKVVKLCPVCVGAGVTVENMMGACTVCQGNYDTISALKTV